MSEYAAIEKEAKGFTDLCVRNDQIDPALFDKLGVKRGLRDKDGKGVLAGITNISALMRLSSGAARKFPVRANCGTRVQCV